MVLQVAGGQSKIFFLWELDDASGTSIVGTIWSDIKYGVMESVTITGLLFD